MFKIILGYLKELKVKTITYLVIAILRWASLLSIPVIISKYIDKVFYTKTNDVKLILFFIITILVWAITSYLFSFLLSILCNDLAQKMQTDAFKHIRKAKLNEINVDNPTVLTSKINNGAFLIPAFFLNTGIEAILSMIGLVVILCIMAYIQPKIAVAMLAILSLNLIVVKLFKNPLEKVNYKLQEKQNLFFASLNNQITNIKLIKTNVWFKEVEEELDSTFHKVKSSYIKKIKVDISYNVLIESFKYIATLALILIVANGILSNSLSVGDFQLIYSYSSIALGYLATLMGVIPNYQEVKVFYARFREVLEIPLEHNGELIIDGIENISIINLSFEYRNSERILENISTELKKGKVYVLRGHNGRGKSTLVNIILGLYEDYSGEILYNNESIKNMNLYDIRKKIICKVDQEPKLVNASVLENLIWGNPNYDKDYLEYLISKFNIPSLDIIIDSKSDNISGGQKQKISLVRTFLKLKNTQNSFLVLDEPSSALDKTSIDAVIDIIEEVKKENIIMIISHDTIFEKVGDEIISL